MKWTLQLVLIIALAGNAVARDNSKGTFAFSESPVNIALDEVQKVFVAPPQRSTLKSAKSPSSTFTVTFVNFPEEAKKAFYYAVSIWEEAISSPVPIHIEARWEVLDGNILAKGCPAIFYNNFSGAPVRNVYYPVALAEKLSGRDMNNGAPDIICRFSSKYKWYFGTDGNTPATHYDMVSSSLHEITHGLGFSGFLNESDGKGYYNNSNELPSIYDYLLFNNDGQQISDKSLFQSNTDELYRQITSDNVKLCQSSPVAQDQKMIDWIYAPPVWNDGTSIYHLKGYAYGEENGLMSPYAVKGRAIHNPGEVTLTILAEMGWKSVKFEFDPLKDLEKAVEEWPLIVDINADDEFKYVKVVYSFDEFQTANYSWLSHDEFNSEYTGNMLLGNQPGKVQYYIEATTIDNRSFRHPAEAPSKSFALNVGPDIVFPDLLHNPVKLVSGNVTQIDLEAVATDNIGIRNIFVDFKVNGILQEPVSLAKTGGNLYCGTVVLPINTSETDLIEYRITAEDNSLQSNKRSFPETGFQPVLRFNAFGPVASYSTNFDNSFEDFACTDFSMSPIVGLKGNSLHSVSMYPESAIENTKYNSIAQLKYPVIIQKNGLLKFDEIVLVEPSGQANQNNQPLVWDYVIVEASKDGGTTWLPLTEEYNSGSNDNWYTAFTNSSQDNSSSASPHESMFVNHTVDLTRNTGLEAGDTAIFRFRLASDHSVNGFGWVISNLEIQENQIQKDELFAGGSYFLYPNPARNHLYIEWAVQEEQKELDVVITDLTGKIIRRASGFDSFYSRKIDMDISDVLPGIYLVSIHNGSEILATNKIIKN